MTTDHCPSVAAAAAAAAIMQAEQYRSRGHEGLQDGPQWGKTEKHRTCFCSASSWLCLVCTGLFVFSHRSKFWGLNKLQKSSCGTGHLKRHFGVGTRHLCTFISNDRLSLVLLQFLHHLCLQALVCVGTSTNITVECSCALFLCVCLLRATTMALQ